MAFLLIVWPLISHLGPWWLQLNGIPLYHSRASENMSVGGERGSTEWEHLWKDECTCRSQSLMGLRDAESWTHEGPVERMRGNSSGMNRRRWLAGHSPEQRPTERTVHRKAGRPAKLGGHWLTVDAVERPEAREVRLAVVEALLRRPAVNKRSGVRGRLRNEGAAAKRQMADSRETETKKSE